jgi:hypothetical protein
LTARLSPRILLRDQCLLNRGITVEVDAAETRTILRDQHFERDPRFVDT